MSKKIYAVKRGRTTGLFTDWEECKLSVSGFAGAQYKGFATRDEAVEYLDAGASNAAPAKASAKAAPARAAAKEEELIVPPDTAIAYVDGSYVPACDGGRDDETGYGVVFFTAEGEEHFLGSQIDAELASMHNVAGEIAGARAAMEAAVRCGVKKLIIYHDYQGIASWCTGEWKANKEGTKAYKAFYDGICDRLSVEFRKVKGHSGVKYNELADKLAKSALTNHE